MSVTRRGLLLGTAGAIAARAADAGTAKHFEGYPGRYGLLHDTTLCVGCRSCEAACHEVNGLPSAQRNPGRSVHVTSTPPPLIGRTSPPVRLGILVAR